MRNGMVHRSRTICESLCPFLYQTRTLSRCATLWMKRTSLTISENDQESILKTPPRDFHRLDDPSSPSRQAREDDSDTQTHNLPGSTVTPAERAAFRRLISKFGSTSELPGYGTRQPTSTGLGLFRTLNESTDQSTIEALLRENIDTEITNILSLFAPETAEMKLQREDAHAIADTKSRSATEHQPYPAWRVRDATLNALKTIAESLNRALESTTNPTREYLQNPRPADLAVWQIIESQVFAQMTALRSISSPSGATGTGLSISEYQRATLEDVQMLKTTPPCLKSLDPQLPLLPLLSILYPSSTLLAIRTYLRHLPVSPCVLAMMPQAKSMGAVSYLLTSNIHFFNALIHLYWTIYSDFAKVKNVIEEMKQNCVAPNTGTAAILENIRRERSHDLGLGVGGTNEQNKKVENQTQPDRSHQWWQMQGQGQGLEEILEKINSGQRYTQL